MDANPPCSCLRDGSERNGGRRGHVGPSRSGCASAFADFALAWASAVMKEDSVLSDSHFQSIAEVGTDLGTYTLEEVLGTGAMGTVFRARHNRLKREVAIKLLNPDWAD